MNPGVGIGGEPRTVLPGHPDQAHGACLEHLVQSQDVISRNPKNVLDALRDKPVDQVLTDGHDLG